MGRPCNGLLEEFWSNNSCFRSKQNIWTHNMECPSEQEVIFNNWHTPPTTKRQGYHLHVHWGHYRPYILNLTKTQRNLIPEDLNIHVDDAQDNDTLAFNDTMMALSLDQCVNSCMPVHGNKLDLVFTEVESDLIVSSHTAGIFISDYRLVTATLNIRKPKLERKPVIMRRIKVSHSIPFHKN